MMTDGYEDTEQGIITIIVTLNCWLSSYKGRRLFSKFYVRHDIIQLEHSPSNWEIITISISSRRISRLRFDLLLLAWSFFIVHFSYSESKKQHLHNYCTVYPLTYQLILASFYLQPLPARYFPSIQPILSLEITTPAAPHQLDEDSRVISIESQICLPSESHHRHDLPTKMLQLYKNGNASTNRNPFHIFLS